MISLSVLESGEAAETSNRIAAEWVERFRCRASGRQRHGLISGPNGR